MAYVIRTVVSDWTKYFIDNIDRRADAYFLIHSPQYFFGIVIFYCAFVLKIGPRIMKNRKPFDLRSTILLYNLGQIGLNGFMFLYGTHLLIKRNPSFTCYVMDKDTSELTMHIVNIAYLYVVDKLLDLIETVIFVLRKKQNQVTFLHVYHHLLMTLGTWLMFRYQPGGQVVYIAYINTFIHFVMYIYYFISAWEPKYITEQFKKTVTIMQIIQHFMGLMIVLIPFLTPSCQFSKFISYILIPQGFFMICLFSEFYYKTYIKKKIT